MLALQHVGERIAPVAEIAKDLSCGAGTVKTALALLEDAEVIRLRSRGHLGTYIEMIDYAGLWDLSGEKLFSIAMPLPYSRRYEALATGLQHSFREQGIPLSVSFQRGATFRFQAVREGRSDLALVSGLAADHEQGQGFKSIHDFGPETYVGSHGIIRRREIALDSPDIRLGVDSLSIDQIAMTRLAFPGIDEKHYVECSYTQVLKALEAGHIDATVWNLDEIGETLPSSVESVEVDSFKNTRNTHAVLVCSESDNRVSVAIHDAIASDTVTKVASEVLSGERLPEY
ncbi:hypothetical protein BM477_00470 [Boudabousia marimammalium]|uniref:Uncharacterized protein n=2 Tax=Boudabousia marimammalium TaxID=156892 RepID=A0A1Q5PSC4_9ACTO|nr:hypothetical protein BM477_00470 [Boudabousia marimammalium]